jgi:hypothetical protein
MTNPNLDSWYNAEPDLTFIKKSKELTAKVKELKKNEVKNDS